LGIQTPRVEWQPVEGVAHPDADAAVELARAAGIALDPWQEFILRASLRRNGSKWAAFEVAAVVPRQNGKNTLLEARELAGLFLFGERLIIHSAHLADTAEEAFRRLAELIEANDWLSREVKHVWRANGKAAIELKTGQRIRFRTRTKGGGRGFSGDCIIFDEAMEFPEASQQAIMPVVSAHPDPQVFYTGSAVDQLVHEHGRVLASVRARALRGGDPSLAYFEWSLGYDDPDQIPAAIYDEPEAWAESNPALGRRISVGYVANERRAFEGNPRAFVVERLGVGDWPSLDGAAAVISLEAWASLTDPSGAIAGEGVFGLDVSPDRAWASISVAGTRADGLRQVELVEHKRGTGWVVPWLAARSGARVVLDARGPAGSLVPALEKAGLRVEPVTSAEHGKACGLLYDAVASKTLRHLGDSVLAASLSGAQRRTLGDGLWLWSRSAAGPDISPLVAATLAHWAVEAGAGHDPFLLTW
jgi:phage terminase large subunit-like protein